MIRFARALSANDIIDLAQGWADRFARFNGSPYREPGLT
jgi:uncharacterized membrane protein